MRRSSIRSKSISKAINKLFSIMRRDVHKLINGHIMGMSARAFANIELFNVGIWCESDVYKKMF